jgi:hypothetical protein
MMTVTGIAVGAPTHARWTGNETTEIKGSAREATTLPVIRKGIGTDLGTEAGRETVIDASVMNGPTKTEKMIANVTTIRKEMLVASMMAGVTVLGVNMTVSSEKGRIVPVMTTIITDEASLATDTETKDTRRGGGIRKEATLVRTRIEKASIGIETMTGAVAIAKEREGVGANIL